MSLLLDLMRFFFLRIKRRTTIITKICDLSLLDFQIYFHFSKNVFSTQSMISISFFYIDEVKFFIVENCHQKWTLLQTCRVFIEGYLIRFSYVQMNKVSTKCQGVQVSRKIVKTTVYRLSRLDYLISL